MSYKCDSGCDNKFYNCPPRMSDGRHYTDYRPRCAVTYELQATPMTSYDARMQLIKNGEKIMEKNRDDAVFKNSCAPCVKESTMLPELHKQVCDDRTCSFKSEVPNGLGLGRAYDQPHNKEHNPGSDEQPKYCDVRRYRDVNMYPFDGNYSSEYSRLTSPLGGLPMNGGRP